MKFELPLGYLTIPQFFNSPHFHLAFMEVVVMSARTGHSVSQISPSYGFLPYTTYLLGNSVSFSPKYLFCGVRSIDLHWHIPPYLRILNVLFDPLTQLIHLQR